MSLIDAYKEQCTLMEKVRVPDGEGGWDTRWIPGATFEAAITHDSTIGARVAESEGMQSTYTVTTDRGTTLDFHDVFRRDRDGQTFRVTSDGTDKRTPTPASLNLSQVSAERWELA